VQNSNLKGVWKQKKAGAGIRCEFFALIVIAVIFACHPYAIKAETYKEIGCLDTLAEVKAQFPKADFKRIQNAAWLQEDDVLYEITGLGMSGSIVIRFYDDRPLFKKWADTQADDEQKEIYTKLANAPDDSVTVSWVRWVPDSPIPLQRFILKYGKPEKSGFSDDDLQPYRTWETKGLTAFLSDDEKAVRRVDYHFTKEERRSAYVRKGRPLPAWLKEPSLKKKKK
jgi:hypothetical protein